MNLDIVCYCTKSGVVPIKDFFQQYAYSEKIKELARIRAVIKITAERGGIAGGQYSSPLQDYDFQEMKIKEGENLVRILYFCYHEEKLVLLNALKKPNLYEKAKKNRVKKIIAKTHEETQLYYEDFINNPTNYEKFY